MTLTGSGDLFNGQWDSGLPGGLAASRRPELCINAVEGPVIQSSSSDATTLAQEDDAAQAVERLKLLVQFVSSGVPCVPASALSSPGMVRLFKGVGIRGTCFHQSITQG